MVLSRDATNGKNGSILSYLEDLGAIIQLLKIETTNVSMVSYRIVFL